MFKSIKQYVEIHPGAQVFDDFAADIFIFCRVTGLSSEDG